VFETGELIRLIGGNFETGSLPSTTWETAVTGSGTVTQITGELVLSTGTTANSIAEVQSQDRAEFVAATFNKAHLAFGWDDFNAADVTTEFGMFDPVNNIFSGDGVFFRNTAGTLTLVRRRGGTDVESVVEASFNGNDTFVKDNNIHIYELVYNAGRILFYQDRQLIHDMSSTASVAYNTPHLTLGARIENTNGNTVDNKLRTRGFACSRIGSVSAEPDSATISTGSGVLKNSPGQLINIVTTQIGVSTATLILYDNTAVSGTPFATIDLKQALVDLEMNKKLNFGLAYDTTGAGFEVILSWR
jgi:hypothetical protein